ncbi:dihydrodipicolinate synthase family protein [Clostridium autoethanogenum]|uniref:Dihydrodipicolinate synthase family protein n=3 Tax=Clostridium autoethanogenum TaxID=84023 RepID=A0A3M0SDB4_9CLOT|nr:dihydrodipicolinate synthase family protein [Clostridium autoethanogenum]RMC96520.1 dihydrodipicolinate synthase family protein [Clostridium autoethanogenum]RMC96522.1 dihydrodipicolinate synthase family protein [Clostridium autoethanogenum]
MKREWGGIYPAIMVPLNDDYSINEKEFNNYIDWLLKYADKGIAGLVTNGHTGEITGFSNEERAHITKLAADRVKGKVKIVSGVCAEGTFDAINQAKAAEAAGADAILLMPPHLWLRFGIKPEGALKFVKDVAEAINIKIFIHLYPSNTKSFYPIDLLLEMCKIPNVVAVKMGTRDMPLYERDVRILREKAPDITLLTCHDENVLSTMIQGVDGALIGFSGCVPELITPLYKAIIIDEDLKEGKKINEKLFAAAQGIYGIGEPTGEAHARMKEFLVQRKVFSSPLMRPPLMPLNQHEIDVVTKALADSGVEKVNLV